MNLFNQIQVCVHSEFFPNTKKCAGESKFKRVIVDKK